MKKDNFSFWCPLEINKAIDETTGEELMLLDGIASTADEDSDGEFLDPKGFDVKPLVERGFVNWHHQAKTNPGCIVGEPIEARIQKDGLYNAICIIYKLTVFDISIFTIPPINLV